MTQLTAQNTEQDNIQHPGALRSNDALAPQAEQSLAVSGERLAAAESALLAVHEMVLGYNEAELDIRHAEWSKVQSYIVGSEKTVRNVLEKCAAAGIRTDQSLLESLVKTDAAKDPMTYLRRLAALSDDVVSGARRQTEDFIVQNRKVVLGADAGWEAGGMTLDDARSYIRYLKRSLSVLVEAHAIEGAGASGPLQAAWRSATIVFGMEIEKLAVPAAVRHFTRALHSAAESILEVGHETAPTVPAKPEVAPQPPIEIALPAPAALDPRLEELKSEVSNGMQSALQGIGAVSFSHDEECNEVLAKGADLLQAFGELALASAWPDDPATMRELAERRAAYLDCFENFQQHAADCAALCRAHFAGEGAAFEAQVEKLSQEARRLADAFTADAESKVDRIVGELYAANAAASGDAAPLAPAKRDGGELSAALRRDLQLASAGLSADHFEKCEQTLEDASAFVDRFRDIQRDIRSLEDLRDRAEIPALLAKVGEQVEAFEREKLSFIAGLREQYAGAEFEGAAAGLTAALQKLDASGDAAYHNFSVRAMTRLRGRGLPENHATDPLSDAAAGKVVETALQEFGLAVENLKMPAQTAAERCLALATSAMNELEEVAAALTPVAGRSLQESLVAAKPASDRAQALAKAGAAAADALAGFPYAAPESARQSFAAALAAAERKAAELPVAYRASLHALALEELRAPRPAVQEKSIPGGVLGELVRAANRERSASDPQRVVVEETAEGLRFSKPALVSGIWNEIELSGDLLTLRAPSSRGARAELSVRLPASEYAARRFVELFCRETAVNAGEGLALASSPLARRLIADPELQIVQLANANIIGQDWREILPRLSGATFSNVRFDKVDCRGARASGLKFVNVTASKFDNLFGELEIACRGRCNLNDAGNRWGSRLAIDLGNGSLAGNASGTDLSVKGMAVEAAERAVETRNSLIHDMARQQAIEAELAVAGEYRKGIIGHMRDNGVFAGLRSWWSARSAYSAKGKGAADYEALQREHAELTGRIAEDRRHLANFENAVRSNLGNLIFDAARGEQSYKMNSVRLSAPEITSVRDRRGAFGDLKEVLRGRIDHSARMIETTERVRISRNGVTISVEKLPTADGKDAGYAVLQIVRADGTRLPLMAGGNPREMLKLRYETAIRAVQAIMDARGGEEEKAIRRLNFARAQKRRDLRRVTGAGEEAQSEE